MGDKNEYAWDYLIPEKNNRTRKLIKILKPFIKENENVLDINCGFSPLTPFFTKNKNRVIGFDINQFAISYCQRKYKSKYSSYQKTDDRNFDTEKKIDVLVFLGISPGQHPLESSTEKDTTIALIIKKQPRLIILEASINYQSGYQELCDFLQSTNSYKLKTSEEYSFDITKECENKYFNLAKKRTVSVFEKSQSFFSINEDILGKLLIETVPAAQGQSLVDLNIGFGFIFYSLVRTLHPQTVVTLGSLKGFSPMCFSLGIKDNGRGKVYFVDAGYSDSIEGKTKASGGEGFWKDKKATAKLFKKFGVEKIITPRIEKTSDFYKYYKKNNLPPIDLLYIDANHTFDGFKYDFETFCNLLSQNGTIVFHDALVEEHNNGYTFGVKKYYEENILQSQNFQSYRIPIWPGLVILQKTTVESPILTKLNNELKEKTSQLDKIYKSKTWKALYLYKNIINALVKIYKKIIDYGRQ